VPVLLMYVCSAMGTKIRNKKERLFKPLRSGFSTGVVHLPFPPLPLPFLHPISVKVLVPDKGSDYSLVFFLTNLCAESIISQK